MKKIILATLVALTAGLSAVGTAHAAATDEQKAAAKAQAHAKWESLTPEQQAALASRAKTRWNSMTPEQQAEAKTKAKAKWDSMTPEEQAAAKKRFAERHKGATAAK